MDSRLQQLSSHLMVTDFGTINNVVNYFPLHDDIPDTYDLYLSQVGAIISVESHIRISPEATNNYEILGVPQRHKIPHHITEFFHVDLDDNDGRCDLLASEINTTALLKRANALYATLNTANQYLQDIEVSENPNTKLIVHCIRGIHRSPVLMLAIMIHQWPESSLTDIVETLMTNVSLNKPCFRNGELAFIDAYFGLDGKLVQVSIERGDQILLDRTKATDCLKRFNDILGPRSGRLGSSIIAPAYVPT